MNNNKHSCKVIYNYFIVNNKSVYMCVCVCIYIYIYIYNGVGKCQKVGGGGGGAHRHVIYVPSVKNHYERVVFGCMVI